MARFSGALVGLCILSSAALGFSTGSLAAEPSAELIAKAKQEGRVTYYTDLIVDQVVRPLASAFEAKYGIKVDYARGDSQDNVLKTLNEAKAGRPVADMVSLTTGMHSLIDAGVTRPYTSPAVTELAAVYRDANGSWVSPYYYVMSPGINTELVKAADRPKTYEDLLLPKWKGKMVWKPNDTSGAPGFIANILTSMGEERGMEYLRKLAGQNIIVVHASARAILDQVIAGEYPMALQIFNHHPVLSAAKGAPVDWVPLSPAAVTLGQVALVKGSPHPHAAELLLNFLISKEGQQIFQKAGYFPTHPDVPAPWPELAPGGDRFKGNIISPDMIARDLEKWNGLFKQLFR
jgi:ABC-type Fe3+ transport system substrate-binding protein